jgi:hypothetical protein
LSGSNVKGPKATVGRRNLAGTGRSVVDMPGKCRC